MKLLKKIGIGLLVIVLFLLFLIGYWYFRPNKAVVNTDVITDYWYVTDDDSHNSNTDMIEYDNMFYLAYVSSPFHFASDDSIMKIERSDDLGKTWEEVATFNPPDEDIRDPKLAVIDGKLFLYALQNTNFIAEPYITVYTYSENGSDWPDHFEILPNLDGWLFWRPKTLDNETFYNAAYWWEHGKSILLSSTDGINWEIISTIYEGGRNDETEIIFLPDGSLMATARLEYGSDDDLFGNPQGATLISSSDPPYSNWTELLQSKFARLDGPYLFLYNQRVYAVGRYQPDPGRRGPLNDQGSGLAIKRTALYEVRTDGLAYLTELPSSGDTAYVGLVIVGDEAYASYYTSRIDRDWPWVIGMMSPSQILMAKINLPAMEALADQIPAK